MRLLFFSITMLLTISILDTSLAMESDEDAGAGANSAQALPVPEAGPTPAADDWKQQFYQKKYAFSNPRLDMKALNDAIIQKQLNAEQIHQLLRQEAYNANPVAQSKLYGFYTKAFFGVNLVDPEAARELLELGLSEHRTWALWMKAKQFPEGEVTKWHCLAANQNHPAAKKYIETHLDYYRDTTLNFLERLLGLQNEPQLRQQAIQEFKDRWEGLNYGQPFYEVWGYLTMSAEMFSTVTPFINGPQYLKTAADWLHVESVISFGARYTNNIPDRVYFDFYRKACILDHPVDKFNVAKMYITGFEGNAPNFKKALELYLDILDQDTDRIDVLSMALRNAARILQGKDHSPLPDLSRSLEICLHGAYRGDIFCTLKAAKFLENGFEGHPPNQSEALELYLKGAELKGQVEELRASCIYSAAHLISEGFEGQQPDRARALELYKQAMKLGHPLAQHNAAVIIARGFKHPNKKKALLWMEQSIQTYKDVLSMKAAASWLFDGFRGKKPNKKKALEYYIKGAEAGDLECIRKAAMIKESGFVGQAPNKKEALDLYMQGVAKSDTKCMNEAAVLIYNGFDNQAADPEKALQLARRSASLGNDTGMFMVGNISIRKSNATKKELMEAKERLQQAAQLGNFMADREIGFMWLLGKMEEGPDTKKAVAHLSKAAECGDAVSWSFLGIIFRDLTAPRDLEQSVDCFLKAAHMDDRKAMCELGKHYLGVYSQDCIDIEKALFWLEKAASLGQDDANELLNKARQYQAENAPADTDEEDDLEEILEKNNLMNSLDSPLFVLPEEPSDDETFDSHQNEAISDEEVEPISTESNIEENFNTNQNYFESNEPNSVENPWQYVHELQPVNREIRNPKFIREQLRQAGKKQKVRDAESNADSPRAPNNKSSELIDDIQTGKTAHIDQLKLENLFSDPFFANQVLVYETKMGICVTAHNRRTNKHFSTGTHRKHTKFKKDNYDPAFFKELKNVLNLFIPSA